MILDYEEAWVADGTSQWSIKRIGAYARLRLETVEMLWPEAQLTIQCDKQLYVAFVESQRRNKVEADHKPFDSVPVEGAYREYVST